MKSSVHDHYVTCSCGAQYSNPIEKCPACNKGNPQLAKTLNAKDADEPVPSSRHSVNPVPDADPSAPTLNGKDE